MKMISKKIIACILAVLLCAVSPMAFAKEFADGETYKVVLKSADRQYCARTQSNSLAVDGSNPSNTANTVWSVGSWVEFDLDLSTVGRYNLGIVGGGSGNNYAMHKVDLDGKTVIYQETTEEGVFVSSTFNDQKDINIGVINIDTPGTHTIRLELLGVSAIYSQYFFITYLGSPVELSSVKAGDTEIADDDEISAGTDCFVAEFSKNINAEIAQKIDEYVSLKSADGKKINFTGKVDKKKLSICLTDSLEADKEYTLEISNIPDYLNSSSTTPVTFNLTAVEGEGVSKIGSQTAVLDGKKVTLNAQMLSSADVGISGRNFEIYVKHNDGELSAEPVATGVSGEDGFLEAEYELPVDCADGKYTFSFSGDYLEGTFEASVIYVSETTKNTIEEAIKAAEDASSVEAVLTDETNALYIGADTNSIINDSKLEALVYANFIGKSIDFDDIIPTLKKYIAVESYKQAKNASRFPIDNEDYWIDMGLNKAKYDFLLENGTSKATVVKKVISFKNIADADEYIKAIDDYLSGLLLEVYNKTDLTPAIEDVEAYVNEVIYIPLAFEENVSDISTVLFEVTVDGEKMFDLTEISVEDNGVLMFDVNDNVLRGSIFFENKTSSKNLAEISLTVPENAGTYTIGISGTVNYDYEETDTYIDVNIIDKSLTLTAKNKPASKPSGSSSRPSGTSSSRPSGGGGGGSVTVTPVIPQVESFSFSDVSKDHWAFASVDYLVKNGIIEKTQDKKYNPDEKINREEIVKMMVLALGLTDESAKSNLSDVTASSSYYKYIASAEKYGIVLGDDEGKFRIGTQISREDICVILHRAVQRIYSFKASEGLFADDTLISDYAKAAVYDMRGAGIINGMGNGEFAPKGSVTKAQAAKMIYEIVKAVGR